MTREEAIQALNEIFDDSEFSRYEAWYGTAMTMAIEALQTEPTPCEKCIHVKSCRKVIILKNRTYKLVKYCSQGAERKEL